MAGLSSKGIRGFIAKTGYDDDGRVCISCNKYKKRQNFGKDMNGINNKTSSCKVCRREKKKQYRENNKQQDKIYREHKRKLYIGDVIKHNNIEYTVIEYRQKKGYLCKSDDGIYINLSTADNKKYKKKFTIIKYNMAIPKTLAIARAGRQILALSKMTKVEKYYKIIDILTQLYDENILTNTEDSENKPPKMPEKN